MKKTVVILLMLGCSFLGCQLYAEYIAQNDISLMRIQKVFSARYGTAIDGDVLHITVGSKKVFLEIVSNEKTKLLCFSAYYNKSDKESIQNMVILANKWNQAKRFLRVAIDNNGDILCDYHLVCIGGVQSENLLATMVWYFELMDKWEEFVIDGGEQAKDK